MAKLTHAAVRRLDLAAGVAADPVTDLRVGTTTDLTTDLVTVLVPACNEERTIERCLRSVLAQEHEALQVVVVDGASTDRTVPLVEAVRRRDPRVELVRADVRNIPASLNLGLRHARGRWLVRVDAHSAVPPDYVALAVRRLREGWGGVGGRKDAVGRTPAGRAIAVALGSKLGVGNSTYHHGTHVAEVEHLAFGAYPTALLRDLGGWDRTLTANEDFELDFRARQAGHRLLFDPAMRIDWECRQSVRDLWRQYARYGRGKADVALLHPESLSLRHVAPPLFVPYALLAVAVAAVRPARAAAMLAPYAAAIAAESVHCAPRLTGARERLTVPAALVAMHLAWGTGVWQGLASRVRAGDGAVDGAVQTGRSGPTGPDQQLGGIVHSRQPNMDIPWQRTTSNGQRAMNPCQTEATGRSVSGEGRSQQAEGPKGGSWAI